MHGTCWLHGAAGASVHTATRIMLLKLKCEDAACWAAGWLMADDKYPG